MEIIQDGLSLLQSVRHREVLGESVDVLFGNERTAKKANSNLQDLVELHVGSHDDIARRQQHCAGDEELKVGCEMLGPKNLPRFDHDKNHRAPNLPELLDLLELDFTLEQDQEPAKHKEQMRRILGVQEAHKLCQRA